ncbi:MAG: hypothetical protein M0Z79_11580 [Nitrospiraceae bacterium]|nr:hypothetical protein [Nitrospiraceae bacterium]
MPGVTTAAQSSVESIRRIFEIGEALSNRRGWRPAGRGRRVGIRHIKSLAEAIIFQALEDLWTPEEREASLAFFGGEDFRVCAEIAGMNIPEQFKMLRMISKAGFSVPAYDCVVSYQRSGWQPPLWGGNEAIKQ